MRSCDFLVIVLSEQASASYLRNLKGLGVGGMEILNLVEVGKLDGVEGLADEGGGGEDFGHHAGLGTGAAAHDVERGDDL